MNANDRIAQLENRVAVLEALLSGKSQTHMGLVPTAADRPAIKTTKTEVKVTPELTKKVIAAVQADAKIDGKYSNFPAFIVACGLKKYGDKANFKDSTIIGAAAAYGLK